MQDKVSSADETANCFARDILPSVGAECAESDILGGQAQFSQIVSRHSTGLRALPRSAWRPVAKLTVNARYHCTSTSHRYARTRIPKVKSPWSAIDGTAFLERMLSMSQRRVSLSEKGWITLQAARNHSKRSLSEILKAVEIKKLTMSQLEGDGGYHGLVVMKAELATLNRDEQVESKARDLVPAAAFGREIGLRGKDLFLSFVSDGHSPSQKAPHPVTGQVFYYLSLEDIAAFRSSFVTPSMMTTETGAHRNTVVAALTSHRIERFTPGGKDYGPIYLRETAQPALVDLRR